MSTEARVLFYAPSLSGDSRIETALEIATVRLSSEGFAATLIGEAVACLAAHILLTSPEAASGGDGLTRGPVTQEKAGGESRSYGQLQASNLTLEEADLSRTAPGLQFLMMRGEAACVGFGTLF